MNEPDPFPCYQDMISYDSDCEGINKKLEDYMKYYQATINDCEITNLKEVPSWHVPKGAKSQFRIFAHTYKGWKVMKMFSGCLASILKYEN